MERVQIQNQYLFFSSGPSIEVFYFTFSVQEYHTVILPDRTLKKWGLSDFALHHC